jgi:outer membrane murein-binding lipoprotein Lpp
MAAGGRQGPLVIQALLLALLVVAGCAGPSERIAANTTEVRRLAHSSGQRFERIASEADAVTPRMPNIKTEAVAGQGEQARILNAVDIIYMALTGVEDQVPWWVVPLVWICVALAVLGIGFIIWHTGVGRLVKGWLGIVTPTERRAAELSADLINLTPGQSAAAIAALRRSDPTFDAAFRHAAPIRTQSRTRKRKP